MSRPAVFLAFALLAFTACLQADARLYFVGQFGDKAVLHINGKQRLLKIGETSKEGITLLSVNANNAVVRYQGKKQTLAFTPGGGKTYKTRSQVEARIWADASGSFQTPGSINGHMVNFLVDTGATNIAMNEIVAGRLGIDFRYSGTPTRVSTASGIAPAHNVTLASVRVGDIELKNIRATVLEGQYPREVLLGMSFLSRVELERKGKLTILRHDGKAAAPPPAGGNKRLHDMRKWTDARQKERADEKRRKAAQKKQKAEKKKRCNTMKHKLARMEQGGVSWYRTEDSGERYYYSEQEVVERMDKLRKSIRKNCR